MPGVPAAGNPLPAWSLPRGQAGSIALASVWPERVTPEWAWGGSTGAGVRVCVVDSGVEVEHPDIGSLERAVVVSVDEDGNEHVEADGDGDVAGHGTACAGIIRQLAPDAALTSVRVLGSRAKGSSPVLLAGLRWAVAEGFDVVNLSLSTTRRDTAAALHELADGAYFRRTLLVAAAHNVPVESFPWRFSSVISVGSHDGSDPLELYYNPQPPVEFFARGAGVEVPWRGGARMTVTGNSFAAAHVSGVCALIRAKHPELTPFQIKGALHLLAVNVTDAR
jgi:subtilisin family serine protease